MNPQKKKRLQIVAVVGGVLVGVLVLRRGAAGSSQPQTSAVGTLFDPSAGPAGPTVTDSPIAADTPGAGSLELGDAGLAASVQDFVNQLLDQQLATNQPSLAGESASDFTPALDTGPQKRIPVLAAPGKAVITGGRPSKKLVKAFKAIRRAPKLNQKQLAAAFKATGWRPKAAPALVLVRKQPSAPAGASRVSPPTSAIAGRRDASPIVKRVAAVDPIRGRTTASPSRAVVRI